MLIDRKGRLNEETLGFILKTKETNEIKEFLTSNLVREAEFDTFTKDQVKSIQIKGEIKNRFLASKQKIVNAKMIEEAVDKRGTGLIEIKTLPVQVDLELGRNNKVLDFYLDASSANLQNEQSR